MALPPSAYLDARLHAPYHVQVELDPAQVPEPSTYPDTLMLQWCVKRVFRGDGRLEAGDIIRFPLKVYRSGQQARPDDGSWMRLADVAAIRYVEAFLDGTPPALRIKAAQFRTIGECSDAPQMDVSPEPEIETVWNVVLRWITTVRV
jgi:hypothetical protein